MPQLAVLIAVIAAAGVSTPAMAGFSLPYRYASPNGSGVACETAKPCNIATAINEAPHGSTVVIEPGTYGSAAHPMTTSLEDLNGALDIFGLTGANAPTIYDDAEYAFDLGQGSSLSHIKLITAAAAVGVFDSGGTVDGISVLSSASSDGACAVFGILTNSLCVTTGASDTAVEVESTATTPVTLRGVTAEATGAGGIGLLAHADGPGADVTISVTNSIVHGNGTDVEARTDGSGQTAAVTLTHSDYSTSSVNGDGTQSVTNDPSVTEVAPKFVDAAHQNYQQKRGSPTIDTGKRDPAGDTDLLGHSRLLGAEPDMGAYEFLEKPTIAALKAARPSKHVAHLSVRVNPEGLATTVKVVATAGHHQVTSHGVSAGHGHARKTVHLVLHGLKPGTTYRVQAVATNKAGKARSTKRKVRTRK
jgi:hypothetical protein